MTEKSGSRIEKFRQEREELNELLGRYAGREMKSFLGLDRKVYRSGALSGKTKEILGLVASLVLRCDDCVAYHLIRCREQNVDNAELDEALTIGLVVGGSITIPHIRRAMRLWDEMEK